MSDTCSFILGQSCMHPYFYSYPVGWGAESATIGMVSTKEAALEWREQTRFSSRNRSIIKSKIRAYPCTPMALPCWEEASPPCPGCSKLKKRRGGAVHRPCCSLPLPFVVCTIVGNKKPKYQNMQGIPCCHIALLALSSLSSSLLIPFVPLIVVGCHGEEKKAWISIVRC
jgi:hypothetical protein